MTLHGNILRAVVLTTLLAVGQAGLSAGEWYSRGNVQYEKRVQLTLQNSLAVERLGEPVVITMEAIRKVAPDFPGKSFVVVDPGAAADSPCGIEANGNDVPAQADDLDGDGTADELVMLPSLKGRESKTVYIYFTAKDVPQPLYPKRTQVMDLKRADPDTLIAIESDILAYRFKRMPPVSSGFIGEFSGNISWKNRQFPGYSLHLYDPICSGVHTLLGRYDPSEQFGIGSVLARQDGGLKMATASDCVTQAKTILDGRLRSIGEIETTGWQVGDGVYDVKARYSMFAGHRLLRCDLTVTAKNGQGGQFAFGLMKLENEKTDIQVEAGRLSTWGDRAKIKVKDVGLSVLFQPGDVKAIGEVPGGRVIELKNAPATGSPLNVTMYFSAGCKDEKQPVNIWDNYTYWWPDLSNKFCGEFKSGPEFFELNSNLAQKVVAPIAVQIGGLESDAPARAKQAFKEGDYFLANPSTKPLALPGELDLNLMGLDAAGGVEASVKGTVADLVTLDGTARVFISKVVGPLGVEKITLKPGGGKGGESGIKVEEVSGTEGGVAVSSGKAKWLVTGNGLKEINVSGKALAIEQTGVTGAVKVVHNGPVVTIVRVGDNKEFTDYYFFKGTDIVRVVANHAIGFRSKETRSYVGKKAMYVAGCECTETCPWGEWSSDGVFKKETVLYPAEWSALYSPEGKAGMICYGSPSAPEIVVEKGGKLDSPLAAGGRSQELYLAPLEDIRQATDLWPAMSRPFVFSARKDGFACFDDRNGNGVQDTFHVTDRNGNGMPDFDGDRWAFDMDSDDALQMVMEFEAKPRRMKVYCDTVSGTPLHSNHLSHYFGDTPPTWGGSPPHHKYDGCLSAAELEEPFYVYESIGDGFFKGPVTEGGFIASGKVTALRDGPILGVAFPKYEMVTSLDLDSDGDCDIWTQDGPSVTQNNGMTCCGKHERYVNYCVPDLSDSNLEPLTVVNPYTGLAYYAIRYFSFLMLDNSKIYQGGVSDGDGIITGGQNWPQAGTWDIDNDGLAEGYIYHEMTHTLGLDLAKKRTAKDDWARERQHYQRDLFEAKVTLPVNFGIITPWTREVIDANPAKSGVRQLMLPVGSVFPINTYTDPHGNKISIHADFLPDKWHGERLECKQWPDGQWDYWPTNNNWNSFVKQKHRYVRINFWNPGRDNGGDHEGCNTQMLTWPNPGMRSEIDADGTSSFYLYLSPFLNGLHYQGMEFGMQLWPDKDHAPWPMPPVPDAYKLAKPLATWVKNDKYSAEYAQDGAVSDALDYLPNARQGGKMFLYYVDDDRDGYADTYLLDDKNDGDFEKRLWYQKDKGILSVYDAGALSVAARKLEFPGYSLELKNYEKLVEMYRNSLTRPGLLREVKVKNGRCENSGATFTAVLAADWLPQVAVDVVHVGGKNLWKDFGPAGLDTLGRVLSESPVEIKALEKAYAPEVLAGIDMLVIGRLESSVAENEKKALQDYVKGGGILLIMAGDKMAEAAADPVKLAEGKVPEALPELGEIVGDKRSGGSSSLADLAAEFGVKIMNEKAVNLVPGQCKWSEIIPGMKESGKAGLLEGVAPVFLEARKVEGGAGAKTLLEYSGQPLIVETQYGKGRVLVVPANVFLNGFMCLPGELRKMPFKPGNQQLAKNLARYLLGAQMSQVLAMDADEKRAQLRLRGRGGEIRLQAPWKECVVRMDGKDTAVEIKDGIMALKAPRGEALIELTPK